MLKTCGQKKDECNTVLNKGVHTVDNAKRGRRMNGDRERKPPGTCLIKLKNRRLTVWAGKEDTCEGDGNKGEQTLDNTVSGG